MQPVIEDSTAGPRIGRKTIDTLAVTKECQSHEAIAGHVNHTIAVPQKYVFGTESSVVA